MEIETNTIPSKTEEGGGGGKGCSGRYNIYHYGAKLKKTVTRVSLLLARPSGQGWGQVRASEILLFEYGAGPSS